MAMLEILQFPNPRLHLQAEEVAVVDDAIRKIVADMTETMHNTPNTAGLAAIQLGIQKRIVVMDLSAEKNQPMCFINPVLSNFSEEKDYQVEGCLSVELAEFHAPVWRPITVSVDALDVNGDSFHIDCTGFLARCIQHEVDHLNGVLFVDYLSDLKRKRLLDKIKKSKRIRDID